MSDTQQEYEIKSIGLALHDGVTETLVIKGEDGEKSEYKVGDKVSLSDDQKKHLNSLGIRFTSADQDEEEESDEVTETAENSNDTMYP